MDGTRRGEVHDGDIVEVNGDRFHSCHFFDCQLVGIDGSFVECSFVNVDAIRLRGRCDYNGCVFMRLRPGQ